MQGWEASDESSGSSWLSGGILWGGEAGAGGTRISIRRSPLGKCDPSPTVSTPSTSTTKLKAIAILGHQRHTHVSVGATLSAKERKSCADSNGTQQGWGHRD